VIANALFDSVGKIFEPIFSLFATILAFFYSLIPNYAVAITLLTLLIMACLTPLTVKSAKSMVAMQRVQPEIKKLQVKYKGPENRQTLNEEMMKLYKEEKVNPAGGCLPMLLQFPFLIVLYTLIRGLTNMDAFGHSAPKYIAHSSQMYHDLIASNGAMKAFGMDLALKPFSTHSSWYAAIPYFVLVAAAVGLSYLQMAQLNARNKNNPNQPPNPLQNVQKFFPILFAYIYFLIPAAVVLYMVVSSMVRVGTQEAMFRLGIITPPGAPVPAKGKVVEKSIPEQASSAEGDEEAKKAHPRAKGKRQRKDRQ
jgi:YidC/Oxa1 family membrane protein insertase